MTPDRPTCEERELTLFNALARALIFLDKGTSEAEDARQVLCDNAADRDRIGRWYTRDEPAAGRQEQPAWLREMHEHFQRTGCYRVEDVQRVLGDQRVSVGAPNDPTSRPAEAAAVPGSTLARLIRAAEDVARVEHSPTEGATYLLSVAIAHLLVALTAYRGWRDRSSGGHGCPPMRGLV